MNYFDIAEFTPKIVSEINNENLTREQRQVLFNLYYHPDKLNSIDLMQLLQIKYSQIAFTQELIIYLWETRRKLIVNTAKNNKYIFKLKKALAIPSALNTNLREKILYIARELNFSSSDGFIQRPFYQYFEEEVQLPIPETPETMREIPTLARIAAIEKASIERQVIQEQEKKISVFAFTKTLIINLINKLSTKIISPSVNVTDLSNSDHLTKANSQAQPNLLKQTVTKIINAFQFIKKLTQLKKKTQASEQTINLIEESTAGTPKNHRNYELVLASPLTAVNISLSAGINSPFFNVEHSPEDINSPSSMVDSYLRIGSPSPITESALKVSSPPLITDSYLRIDSPSPITNSTLKISSPPPITGSYLRIDSPSPITNSTLKISSPSPITDDYLKIDSPQINSTKKIFVHITTEDNAKQTLALISQEQAQQVFETIKGGKNKKIARALFGNKNTSDGSRNQLKKQQKSRVTEVFDENQENINPNIAGKNLSPIASF